MEKFTEKQKQEHRLIAFWTTPEQKAEIDTASNGNRSEFIRQAVAEKLERVKEQ